MIDFKGSKFERPFHARRKSTGDLGRRLPTAIKKAAE
jgi:hypothetical protein